ncbi:glycosyltransferase [bacterium]|nr:glycosyltransferase [bacterium]
MTATLCEDVGSPQERSVDRFDVSLIIPAYNRAELLPRSLKSALTQETALTYEIIVVDDGSTDNTLAVLNSFSDSRVRVLRQANAGTSVARAVGVAAALGSRVCFLDSDDVAAPNYIQDLWDSLESCPAAVLAFGRVGVLQSTQSWDQVLPERDDRGFVEDPLRELLLKGCFTVSMNLMARRDVALAAANDPAAYRAANDYNFCLRAALQGPFVFASTETMLIDRKEDGISAQIGHLQVAFATIAAVRAAKASGRKDDAMRKALRERVSTLWPSAFAQCLFKREFLVAMRVLGCGFRWGQLRDLKTVYWTLDHEARLARSAR